MLTHRSFARTLEKGRQAVELAERHGWTDDPAAGFANIARTFGTVLAFQGRPEEAEPWIQRAERILRAEVEPVEGLAIRSMRGLLELARGQDADALAAFQAANRLAERLAEPSLAVLPNRSLLVQTLVRLGETARAEQAITELGDQDRDDGAIRISLQARHAHPGRDRRPRRGPGPAGPQPAARQGHASRLTAGPAGLDSVASNPVPAEAAAAQAGTGSGGGAGTMGRSAENLLNVIGGPGEA